MKKVWTFVIRGGEPFDLTLPGGPPCNHTGGRTLWKLVGTKEVAGHAKALMRQLGAEVALYTETESPEQAAERAALQGRDPLQ